MPSKAEQFVSQALRVTLASCPVGATITGSEQFPDVLSGLCFFIPGVLWEHHREWMFESLDGIYPLHAQKTNEGEAEICGQCILFSDQTLVPLHLLIQVSLCGNEMSWLELKLGESGDNGMVRRPYTSPMSNLTMRGMPSDERLRTLDWAYSVEFGKRRE